MNFKNAILIQARVGSSRLRSKVLFKINGLSILEIGYKRLKRAKKVNQIIYLIPSSEENLILKKEIESFGGLVFLGSEKDVMDRYLSCANFYNIQNIIRITSDCPLVDPSEVDKFFSIYEFMNTDNLYLSNYTPPELASYCNGSDIEIFSKRMLEEASNIFKSHKLHLYQRLVSNGMSHSQVSMIYMSSISFLGLIYIFCTLKYLIIASSLVIILGIFLDKNYALDFNF